jgi:ADP-heptose:LPS heptosyltransferase
MKILLYHFGYYGDIIVVGQNFARELKIRFPNCEISLMVRPRINRIYNIVKPLNLFKEIIYGEKTDFKEHSKYFEKSFIIDEFVYPEGNLRTIFSKAGFPFRQHKLHLEFQDPHLAIAKKIVGYSSSPIITTQDDMCRKWDENKVKSFQKELHKLGKVIVLGPNVIHLPINRKISFLESCAVAHLSDLYAGIDSGIAHGAALSGTQTILIPPLIPEYFISPTEYANPFIENEKEKHHSIRPRPEDFCGNYKCLKGTKKNAVEQPIGNPLKVKCNWNKKHFFSSKPSCFTKISVDMFYDKVESILKNRELV